MARRPGPASKSLGGCVAIIIVLALFASGGPVLSICLGGLLVLAGFSQMGDRRRSPFDAFGMLSFGVILLLIGLAMMGAKK